MRVTGCGVSGCRSLEQSNRTLLAKIMTMNNLRTLGAFTGSPHLHQRFANTVRSLFRVVSSTAVLDGVEPRVFVE